MTSTSPSNKKIMKDFLYKSWTTGTFEKADQAVPGSTLEYSFTGPTALIYAREQQQVMTLKSYVKNVQPTATSIYGYQAWPVGCMPAAFQVKQAWCWTCPEPGVASLLEAAKKHASGDLFLGYVISFDSAKKMIIPVGFGAANIKQYSLKAMEEKEL